MLKGCIFHWQIFRGGFNAEKYADDEKFLSSAERERHEVHNSRMMMNDENDTRRKIISSLFFVFEIYIENTIV